MCYCRPRRPAGESAAGEPHRPQCYWTRPVCQVGADGRPRSLFAVQVGAFAGSKVSNGWRRASLVPWCLWFCFFWPCFQRGEGQAAEGHNDQDRQQEWDAGVSPGYRQKAHITHTRVQPTGPGCTSVFTLRPHGAFQPTSAKCCLLCRQVWYIIRNFDIWVLKQRLNAVRLFLFSWWKSSNTYVINSPTNLR